MRGGDRSLQDFHFGLQLVSLLTPMQNVGAQAGLKMQQNRGIGSPGGSVMARGEFSRSGVAQDTFSLVC